MEFEDAFAQCANRAASLEDRHNCAMAIQSDCMLALPDAEKLTKEGMDGHGPCRNSSLQQMFVKA